MEKRVDKTMKTVVIGNGASIFIKDHILEVCKVVFSEIILLSSSEIDDEVYVNSGVKVIYIGPLKNEQKLSDEDRRIASCKRWDDICEKIDDIDVLQVHYCFGGTHMYCYKKLAIKSAKQYMVYWGSDLLRADLHNIELNREAIELSYQVICLTESLKNALHNYYGELVEKKTKILDFGVVYEDIEEVSKELTRSDCKRNCGIPSDKTTVMIGYNGKSAQQHLKVIEAIKRIEPTLKDKMYLIFPMSYGRDEEYRNVVENAVIATGIPYFFIDKFLSRTELVELRLATDVFIHAQITDALSNTLCETMYAGAKIINPTWIDYSELKRAKICYYEYDDFGKLTEVIEKAIKGMEKDNSFMIEELRKKLCVFNDRRVLKKRWEKLLSI